MVKAPSTSHGLDRMFKPWRKGKSAKSKSGNSSSTRQSLKQQLRGLQRLYDNKKDTVDASKIEEWKTKIQELREQIDSRKSTELERTHAKKSHKIRFLERQRLTRRYKHLLKQQQQQQQQTNENIEQELFKIALDQVYVAHYDLSTSYLNLYQSNQQRRTTLNDRLLFKMAQQRKRALESVHRGAPNVSWIDAAQYQRIQHVTTWNTQLERTTFGIRAPVSNEDAAKVQDDRFQWNESTTQKILEQQAKVEMEMDDASNNDDDNDDSKTNHNHKTKKDIDSVESRSETNRPAQRQRTMPSQSSKRTNENGSDTSNEELDDNGDSDNDDEADPLVMKSNPEHAMPNDTREQPATVDEEMDSDSESSSSSDSRSSSSSSSGSSSDSSSESSSDEESKSDLGKVLENFQKNKSKSKIEGGQTDEEDDFLVAVEHSQETEDVFAKAKARVPAQIPKGDKSQGWATQRQAPGQFRKNQLRQRGTWK